MVGLFLLVFLIIQNHLSLDGEGDKGGGDGNRGMGSRRRRMVRRRDASISSSLYGEHGKVDPIGRGKDEDE